MPQLTSSGTNSQGNSVRHEAFATLRDHPDKARHARSLSCVQYTSYNNGGYSYNNAPSSSNNHSGSHYYSPSGNTSGFYTQNGGKSGGGYSFYQNRCAASRLSSSLAHLVFALSCPTQRSCLCLVCALFLAARAGARTSESILSGSCLVRALSRVGGDRTRWWQVGGGRSDTHLSCALCLTPLYPSTVGFGDWGW